MRLSVLRLLAIVLCCCSLGVLPAHAAANHTMAVNLKVGDLPAGFARTAHQTDATSDEEQFTNKSLAGLIFVESDVLWLSSSDLAKLAYDGGKSKVTAGFKAAGLTHYKRVVISPVGSSFVAYQGTGKANGVELTMFMIVFQRGDYVAIVGGAGLAGFVHAPQVLKLAHIVDTRVQHAG